MLRVDEVAGRRPQLRVYPEWRGGGDRGDEEAGGVGKGSRCSANACAANPGPALLRVSGARLLTPTPHPGPGETPPRRRRQGKGPGAASGPPLRASVPPCAAHSPGRTGSGRADGPADGRSTGQTCEAPRGESSRPQAQAPPLPHCAQPGRPPPPFPALSVQTPRRLGGPTDARPASLSQPRGWRPSAALRAHWRNAGAVWTARAPRAGTPALQVPSPLFLRCVPRVTAYPSPVVPPLPYCTSVA